MGFRCQNIRIKFINITHHTQEGLSGMFWHSNLYDVGVKRYFAPNDTGLLRALHSRNPQNIHNSLIFLRKMATYSCFWRVPRSKILLQASLHQISDLGTLISSLWKFLFKKSYCYIYATVGLNKPTYYLVIF